MDKCREAFEDWCFKSGLVLNKRFFKLNGQDDEVSSAWEAWQSRQAEVDEANAKSQMYRDEKTHAINRWSQIRKEVEEKDKRIADLELALTQIKSWESHPKNYETNFGSWGLRDYYRDLAEKALRGEHE